MSGRNDKESHSKKMKWCKESHSKKMKWYIRKNIPKKWVHSYFSGKTCQAKGRENVVECVGGIFNNVKDKVQSLNYILATVDT